MPLDLSLCLFVVWSLILSLWLLVVMVTVATVVLRLGAYLQRWAVIAVDAVFRVELPVAEAVVFWVVSQVSPILSRWLLVVIARTELQEAGEEDGTTPQAEARRPGHSHPPPSR